MLALMPSTLSFELEAFQDDASVFTVVPVIDGEHLTDLIHRFERDVGMERRDESYGGLIPAFFRFGAAEAHYLPPGDRKLPVLGCECGEWGCWPLMVRVHAGTHRVAWTDFEQPHRPAREYSAFGPFSFDRAMYEQALRTLARSWNVAVAR